MGKGKGPKSKRKTKKTTGKQTSKSKQSSAAKSGTQAKQSSRAKLITQATSGDTNSPEAATARKELGDSLKKEINATRGIPGNSVFAKAANFLLAILIALDSRSSNPVFPENQNQPPSTEPPKYNDADLQKASKDYNNSKPEGLENALNGPSAAATSSTQKVLDNAKTGNPSAGDVASAANNVQQRIQLSPGSDSNFLTKALYALLNALLTLGGVDPGSRKPDQSQEELEAEVQEKMGNSKPDSKKLRDVQKALEDVQKEDAAANGAQNGGDE